MKKITSDADTNLCASTSNSILSNIVPLVVVLILFGLSPIGVLSQSTSSVTDNSSPAALASGESPGTRIEDIANVGLYNGNLNFGLTLATVGGRGGLQVPINLTIERHWRYERRFETSSTGQPIVIDYFTSGPWNPMP